MPYKEFDLKDLNILIVEDNNGYLNLLASMLRNLGVVQIHTARDGTLALEFLYSSGEAALIDLIICDWDMPRLNGLELLRQIRAMNPDFPFLIITGLADEQAVLEAKAARVTGFLAKPFTLDELRKKLAAVMRSTEAENIPASEDWFEV